MPLVLQTIDEYIATQRKKDTIWLVFNTKYNDVHAFKNADPDLNYLNEENTDEKAKEEFLAFMAERFPETKLVPVFDLVGRGYLQWPYLGSMAIDTDIGSEVYNALSEKYGNPYEDAIVNNHVLWVMQYDDAETIYKERQEDLKAEFGDDD